MKFKCVIWIVVMLMCLTLVSAYSETEFNNIKSRAKGEFKVSLETTAGLANQILSFVQRGYGVEYIDKYPAELEKVNLKQVNDAIKKYVDPEKVVMVVAGSVDSEGKPLE